MNTLAQPNISWLISASVYDSETTNPTARRDWIIASGLDTVNCYTEECQH